MTQLNQKYFRTLSRDTLYALKSKLIDKLAEKHLADSRKDALIKILAKLIMELRYRESNPNIKPINKA